MTIDLRTKIFASLTRGFLIFMFVELTIASPVGPAGGNLGRPQLIHPANGAFLRDDQASDPSASLPFYLAAAAPIPEFYGVYAHDRGRLVRLKEHSDVVTKFSFSPDVTFVIYEKWVSRLSSTEGLLKKVFYVRSRYFFGFTGQLNPRPEPVNGWGGTTFLDAPLSTLMKPLPGQTEAIEVVPQEPLAPGVYSFAKVNFSVRFADINMDNFCVDEYVGGPVIGAEYRRCSDSRSTRTPDRKDTRPSSLLSEGWKHYRDKNYQAAEIAYREVLTQEPDNFEAHGQLGAIYLRLADFENSKFHSQRAINLRPDDSNPYYNMACAYARTGKTEMAINYIRQAVAKGFKDFEWMKKDPDLESIRHDPRFKNLLSKEVGPSSERETPKDAEFKKQPQEFLLPFREGDYKDGQSFKGTGYAGLFHLGKDYCVTRAIAKHDKSLEGTPFYPIRSGKVVGFRYTEPAHREDGLGNYVVIDHGNEVVALYAHLAKVYIKEGQVSSNTILGEAGDVNLHPLPNCAHLHLEIRRNAATDLNVSPNLRYGYVSRDGRTKLTAPLGGESAVLEWIDSNFYDPDKILMGRSQYEVTTQTSVYDRPTEGARRLANIEPGTRVNVVNVIGDWLEIKSKHGRPAGFIRKDFAVLVSK